MTKIIRHSLVVLFIIFYSRIAFAGSAVILLYHKFDNPNSPSTNTPIETFIKQMRYLKTHHYHIVKLSNLCNLLKNHKIIPDKTVAISIDDGYKSTTKAIKLLKQYNFPATIFLYTDAYNWPAFLNWTQINKIVSDPLFDIGNHTASHSKLDELTDKQIAKEISFAQKTIKKETGVYTDLFAYPYGYYNKKVVQKVKDYGFKCAFSQDIGAVDEKTNPYKIPRIAMTGSNFSMKEFKKKLLIKPLHLYSYAPKENIASTKTIKIILTHPKNYSDVKIYISEKGWLKTEYNRKSGTAYATTGVITRFRNRIVVKAFNEISKDYEYFTWMVHNLSYVK